MATKKLKVELELETAKAKQQLGHMGDGVGSSSPSPSSRSLDKLSEETRLNTHQMMSMTRAFSGMALGLAASYSARYFDKGSMAETAIGYVGSILSGASMGAMAGTAAGPYGMAGGAFIGGAMGAVKEYLDRAKTVEDALEDWENYDKIRKENEDLSNFLKSMTSPFNTEALSVRLATMSDRYEYINKKINGLVDQVADNLKSGNLDEVAKLRLELDRNYGYRNKIMSVAEAMDNSYGGPSRPSMSATDELMKIGGGFGLPGKGSSAEATVIIHGIEQQNELLRDIRANTMKKGSTWL